MLAGPPGAPEGDPDADTHDHRNFFFPDNRAFAAYAAGFGWCGGDGRELELKLIKTRNETVIRTAILHQTLTPDDSNHGLIILLNLAIRYFG